MARAILAELESIKTQLEIIAEEMPGHRSQLYEINARITRVEESTKSAHHRIVAASALLFLGVLMQQRKA